MKTKRKVIISAVIVFALFIIGVSVGVLTKDLAVNTETVEFDKDGGKISVEIPEGWEYVINKEKLPNSTAEFSIDFKPEGVEDGYISLQYCEIFGVCGTDLSTEELNVGNYKVIKGTYDNSARWFYIKFHDTDGFYVVINTSAYWYYQYEDEVMAILSTVKIGYD